MLRSMLVGLDGSLYADAAVDLGIRWARRNECMMVAVGVIDEPAIRHRQSTPVGGSAFKKEMEESRVHEAQREVEQYLSRFSVRCANEGVAYKQLEEVGWPEEEILREAQRYDLLLMGQQSYFHSESRQRPEDTLQRILHNTPRPVVAVPLTPPEGKSILIAYDGSVQAARATQAFVATGLYHEKEVHVLSVHASDSVLAAKTGELAVDFLQGHGIRAKAQHLVSGNTTDCILQIAEQVGSELIVMGCYGQSRIREFFLGSITKSVLSQTKIPLFLFH